MRDNPSSRAKGWRDKVHTWYLLTAVRALAEDLFGGAWKERAEFDEADW